MGRRTKSGLGAAALAIAVLAAAAGALAASRFTPTLRYPNHHRVRAGTITIRVRAPHAKQVFVQIEPHRKLEHGFLASCVKVNHGCAYISLKRPRHGDVWTYTGRPQKFKGWWSTTRHKYYWQAQSFAKSPPCSFKSSDCVFNSTVGWFKVR